MGDIPIQATNADSAKLNGQTNVEDEREDEVDIDLDNPPFPLTSIDRELLSMRDEDFHRITWCDLKTIIANNDLEQLKRTPSDLHRYLRWSHITKKTYGSITSFVINERLHWTPLTSSPPTFTYNSPIPLHDPRDYAVLVNDWPYGVEPGILHLLAWSKTPIAVDERNGDITEESRRVIEEFVERTFVRALDRVCDGKGEGKDRVVWFKNWVALQSVRGVEHVHVLVRDAPEAVVRAWTERKDLDV